MFLSVTDFVGKFQLHTGIYDQSKLTSYIDRYEKKYLVQLFGVELYDEFMGDLVGNVPQSPNFIKLFEPFNAQLNMCSIVMSEGILDMLKGFVYFEYAKDLINQMTPFGNVSQNAENSTVVTTLNTMLYTRYNESIKTYRAIQDYMIYNTTVPIGQIVSYNVVNQGAGYLSDLINYNPVGGNGSGYSIDVEMELIGGVTDDASIVDGGTGYTDGQECTVTGGSGTNCVVIVNVASGVVQSITIKYSGQDYLSNDELTLVGGNGDAKIKVNSLGIGSVKEITDVNVGNGYQVGDLLTIEGADLVNAEIEVTYVGKGDYRKLQGYVLQYAYWL